MTNHDLAKDYLHRASIRLEAVELLFARKSFADVIRESQEIVELILKGYLRRLKIDPPKWHDVSSVLIENPERLDTKVRAILPEIEDLSKTLRKERENSFYGDEDLIPSDSYTEQEAKGVLDRTRSLLNLIKPLV